MTGSLWRNLPGPDGFTAHRMGRDGPPIVLVHGIEDRFDSWDCLAAALSADFQVTAFDMPWRTGNDYQWCDQATPGQWLRRFLEQHNLEDAFMVAHSFGGLAALELIAARREPAATLLIAPAYCTRTEAEHHATPDALMHALRVTMTEAINLRLGTRQAMTPQMRSRIRVHTLAEVVPRAFPTLVRCILADRYGGLAEATRPVEIVISRDDPTLSPGASVELGSLSPHMTLRHLPGTTHSLHRTDWQLVHADAHRLFTITAPAVPHRPSIPNHYAKEPVHV